MIASSSLRDRVVTILCIWSCVGLFVLLAGQVLIEDGSRYTTQVNLMLFLPGLLLVVLAKQWANIFDQPVFWMLIALLVWVLCAVFFNPGGDADIKRWLRLCLQIIVFVLTVSIVLHQERFFAGALIAGAAVAMVCAWLSLCQNYFIEGRSLAYRVSRLESSGISGVADFGNAILAALFYAAMLILSVGLWSRIKKGWRFSWLLGICGLGIAVYATYSRGVWIALGAALLFYWALTLSRQYFICLLGVIVAGAFAVLLVSPGMIVKGFLNLNYREEIWQYALEELSHGWFWGVGPAAPFSACIEVLSRCFNQAHSLYLQFMFNFGMIGLAVLGALLISLLFVAWRHRGDDRALIALSLLVFALVAGVASYSELFSRPGLVWMFFWLPVGMLLGVGVLAKRQEAA